MVMSCCKYNHFTIKKQGCNHLTVIAKLLCVHIIDAPHMAPTTIKG